MTLVLTVPKFDAQPILASLDRDGILSASERAAVAALPVQRAEIAAGTDIAREGRPASGCVVILDGVACTYKLTGSGKRQITAFHIAGDLPTLDGLHAGMLGYSVATLSRCRVALIAQGALRELCAAHPRVAAALWRETLLQGAVCREWVLNIGRREALGRTSHLLCEMVMRHRLAGLSTDHTCDLSITQIALADALGLSPVHVNRVLHGLRGQGLIAWSGARLTVLDWDRLVGLGDFDPAYLRAGRDSGGR